MKSVSDKILIILVHSLKEEEIMVKIVSEEANQHLEADSTQLQDSSYNQSLLQIISRLMFQYLTWMSIFLLIISGHTQEKKNP